MVRRWVWSVVICVALAAPLALLVLLLTVPTLDLRLHAPTGHFFIVSVATLASALIGLLLLIWVDSIRSTQTVFLGLGFVAVAVIFATHGLSTPGFIVGGAMAAPEGASELGGYDYGYAAPAAETAVDDHQEPFAVIVSAGLSQLVGAMFILLSGLPAGLPGIRATTRVRASFLPATLTALVAYFVVAMFMPSWLRFVPTAGWWNWAVMGVTLAMLAYATWRYWRVWRLTSFAGQLGTVMALVLLMETQISMHLGEVWHASWWLYHGLMLAAFLVLLGGWLAEARRAHSLLLFPRSLALRDGISRVHVARPDTLEALEIAVATKDTYTGEHMGRVAEYATALGEALALDKETLRRIDLAGRIHDVGKIAIPDAVLLKPGRLTEKEFEQVKHHAERGERIARASRALREVAPIVRAHHERFSGGGYPDGIAGDAIPLEARVISVVDTFDALSSPRVYRAARPLEEALAELERVAATQLDPEVVRAFLITSFSTATSTSVGEPPEGGRGRGAGDRRVGLVLIVSGGAGACWRGGIAQSKSRSTLPS